MSYALHYREEIKDPAAVKELDDLAAYFNSFLKVSFDKSGNLLPSALTPVDPTAPATGTAGDELHHWKNGPWIFDSPNSHNAILVTPDLTGTVNDIAPQGIDTAIGIEFNLSGNLTITGIKAPVGAYRRILILRNNSGAHTITLKHANPGSQSVNQFQLPGSVDIVMSTRQTVWLYYDAINGNWGCFITANTSGGLNGAGGATGGDVFGPSGAVDSNIAVFDTTTGKLIKDGGSKISDLFPAATAQGTGVQTNLGLQKLVIDIPDSAIKSANSVPIDLLVPGGSTRVVIDYWWAQKGPWTNAYSANPSWRLRYFGIASDIITAITPGLSGTGFSRQGGAPAGNGFTSDPTGVKVQLSGSVDVTSVGDTTLNKVTVTVIYHVE